MNKGALFTVFLRISSNLYLLRYYTSTKKNLFLYTFNITDFQHSFNWMPSVIFFSNYFNLSEQ